MWISSKSGFSENSIPSSSSSPEEHRETRMSTTRSVTNLSHICALFKVLLLTFKAPRSWDNMLYGLSLTLQTPHTSCTHKINSVPYYLTTWNHQQLREEFLQSLWGSWMTSECDQILFVLDGILEELQNSSIPSNPGELDMITVRYSFHLPTVDLCVLWFKWNYYCIFIFYVF